MYYLEKQTNPKNIWDILAQITVEEAAESFLSQLKVHTKRSYRTALKNIFAIWEKKGIFNRKASLQTLAQCNLETLLDLIAQNITSSESTKQNRCAAFVSFTKFLCRSTRRVIHPALPKQGANPTFQKIRKKSATGSFTLEEWGRFIQALRKISYRDYLIAKAIFQGAKRCSEVLEARIESINWEEKAIRYIQLKSHLIEDSTYIHYSQEFMNELREYLDGRTCGYIFITRTGCPLTQPHLYRSFAYASVLAKLKKRVHPHMLRASAITSLFKMGYHSDQIMQVSGHANPTMVIYYDKTPIEDNLTKEIKLC